MSVLFDKCPKDSSTSVIRAVPYFYIMGFCFLFPILAAEKELVRQPSQLQDRLLHTPPSTPQIDKTNFKQLQAKWEGLPASTPRDLG